MSSSRPNLGKRLWHSWCVDFSDAGRALVLSGIISLMLGSTTTEIDTFLMVGFLACLALSTIILAFYFRPKVVLTSNLPKRIVAGETVHFSVWVKNCSERMIRELILHPVEPDDPIQILPTEQSVPEIGQGETYEFCLAAYFPKRGVWRFSGLWADTMFPFGWIRTGLDHDCLPTNIIVYPHFIPLQNLKIPTGRRYQPGGIALVSHLGDSAEYIGNREYHDGDNLRLVDWKSWARLGKPVVKEYQEEYFCRIALVIDTHKEGKITSAQKRDFEALLSLSSAIADYLSRQEYLLDIFAAGSKVYLLETGRALAHFENVLEVLACLDISESPTLPLIQPTLYERNQGLSLLIVLLLDWNQDSAQFLKSWIGLGIGLKVIVCNSSLTSVQEPILQSPYLDFQWYSATQIEQGLTQF